MGGAEDNLGRWSSKSDEELMELLLYTKPTITVTEDIAATLMWLEGRGGPLIERLRVQGVWRGRQVMEILLSIDTTVTTELGANRTMGTGLSKRTGRESQEWSGGMIMKALLSKATNGNITITDKAIEIISQNSDSRTMKLLLSKDMITITEPVLIAAAKKRGREMMELLLSKNTDIVITEPVLIAATKNLWQAREVMELLLSKDPDIAITEPVLITAAQNSEIESVELLLSKGTDIAITEPVLVAAAARYRCGREIMELLLSKNTDIVITEPVLIAAAQNEYRRDVMELLLSKDPDIAITESVLIATAQKRRGKEMMELLLSKNTDIAITELVLITAVQNSEIESVELLLSKSTDITITEPVLIAATKNLWQAREVMELLLSKGTDITITELVLIEAAKDCERQVMELLLNKDADIAITEPVLIAAAENPYYGKEAIELLLSKDINITISEPLVTAARRNYKYGREVMELLLSKDAIICDKDAVIAIGTEFGESMFQLLLTDHADKIPQSLRWIQELKESEMFDVEDIVKMLTDVPPEETQWPESPKHNSEKSSDPGMLSPEIDLDLSHQDSCPHCLSSITSVTNADIIREVKFDFFTNLAEFYAMQQELGEKVNILCGIGGLQNMPKVYTRISKVVAIDYTSSCIRFDYEQRNTFPDLQDAHTLSVSLDQSATSIQASKELANDLICNVLDRVLKAIREANAGHFCCDRFTVLIRSIHRKDVVKVVPITAKFIQDLREAMNRLKLGGEANLLVLLDTCWIILNELGYKKPHVHQEDIEFLEAISLHYMALTVQMLAVGLVTYMRSHAGEFQHPLLLGDIESLSLHGLNLDTRSRILLNRRPLSCFGDFVGENVWVFEDIQFSDEDSPRLYLLSTAEDLADTWGQCYFMPSETETPNELSHIVIGDGSLQRSPEGQAPSMREEEHLCHWARRSPLQLMQQKSLLGFKTTDPLLIGALLVNANCPLEEPTCLRESRPRLLPPGVAERRWETTERQVGLNINYQMVGVQFVGIQKKVPGTTLKTEIKNRLVSGKDLYCLTASWGLQVSICTGVAKRVPLKDLLTSEKVLEFTSLRTKPRPAVMAHARNLRARQTDDFRKYLETLSKEEYNELYEFLIAAFDILYYTGIARTASNSVMKIWWPEKYDTRCVQFEGKWPQMLEDSTISAVFATLAPECFVQERRISCRGMAVTACSKEIMLLETAVRVVPWKEDSKQTLHLKKEPRIAFFNEGSLTFKGTASDPALAEAKWKRFPPVPERIRRYIFECYFKETSEDTNGARKILISC